MALCSPARNGELCHTSMSSVTLVSHCFTSLLIFAAFSGLNLHVWLVVMAICEDEFRLKVGPCRRPNGCFILETLKLKTKGAASHRSQGTRGRAGWQTVPLKIVPYEYVHSLVPSVALYTAANTSTGKSNPFLPCCRSADLYKIGNMSHLWRDWRMTFVWILVPTQWSLCFFLGSLQGTEDPLEGMSRWGEQGRESIAICLSHILNCSNL